MKSTLSIIALALTMVLTACTVSDIPVSAVDEGQWAIDESYMDTSVNPGNDFFCIATEDSGETILPSDTKYLELTRRRELTR